MPLDTNVFDKLKTFQDYQRADEEFQLKKQLANAQLIKAGKVDVDELGQQAFLKAAQGMPITSQETAALQYLDAKSPTAAFNPVTGVMEQKPSFLDRAGLSAGAPKSAAPMAVGGQPTTPRPSQPMTNQQAQGIVDVYGEGDNIMPDVPPQSPEVPQKSEWDLAYEQELANAAGNPKLQQSIKETYSKKKLAMNEEESKSAAYADRMSNSEPIINQTASAAMDASQVAKGSIPLVGNFLTSDDYQSSKQAQLDFLNSILRRESGAAISTGEYKSYAKQYFPQPGDSEQVVAQKAINRQEALKGVQRSAGPAYKPATLYNKSKSEFDAKKGAPKGEIKFLGFE